MTSSSELPEWLIEEAPFAGQGQTVAAENADDDNFPSWLDEANDISDASGPDADDDSEEEHEWRLESKERTPETSEPIFEAPDGWVDQLETEPEEISRENPADDDTQPTQIDQTEDETVTNEAVDKEWSFTDGGEASDSIYEEFEIIPDETRLADEAQISGEQEPATAIDPIDEAFSWLMGLRAATENSDLSDDTAQPAFETTDDWLAERNPAIENNESSNELTDFRILCWGCQRCRRYGSGRSPKFTGNGRPIGHTTRSPDERRRNAQRRRESALVRPPHQVQQQR